jgi:hypothetical protein
VRKLILACVLVSCAVLPGMGGQSVPMGTLPAPSAPVAYAYYGNGCAGTSTPACSTGGSSQFLPSHGFVNSTSFTLSTAATVDACAISVSAIDSTTPTWSCAIFTWSGDNIAHLVSGCAQTFSSQTLAVIGYNEAPITGCALSPGAYWVVAAVDGLGTSIDYSSTSNTQLSFGSVVTAWLSTFPASTPFSPSYDLYVKVH